MTDIARDIIQPSQAKPVLVQFHAHWCGPCQMLGPVLDALSRESGVGLVRVDTDQEGELAGAFGVSGIPDVRLYYHGSEIGRFVGFRPKGQVERWIADRMRMAAV